jgi:hypothetical protein
MDGERVTALPESLTPCHRQDRHFGRAHRRRHERRAKGIRSPLRRSALPPVNRGALAHQVGCPLDVCHVAELPQLFRATGVLEQSAIDFECIQVATAKSIYRGSYMRDELAERRLVVGRYHLAGILSL